MPAITDVLVHSITNLSTLFIGEHFGICWPIADIEELLHHFAIGIVKGGIVSRLCMWSLIASDIMWVEPMMVWERILIKRVLIEELVHSAVTVFFKHHHGGVILDEICPDFGIVWLSCPLPIEPLRILIGHTQRWTIAPLLLARAREENHRLPEHINALAHVLINPLFLQEITGRRGINIHDLDAF